MDTFWILILLIFSILEIAYSKEMSKEDKVPFSKSLGFSLRGDFDKNLERTRADDDMDVFSDIYTENQAGIEKYDNDDIATDLVRLKGLAERRRSARMQSAVGRRRARSQAIRREKLNSQSLQSHREHSKEFSLEQHNVR